MSLMAPPPIKSIIDTFDEQGFVILKNFLDDATVRDVRNAVEYIMEQQIRQLLETGVIDDL